MSCRIEIPEITLSAHVGCTDDERQSPQPLLVRAVVRNSRKFRASLTDDLADTVDVAKLRAFLTETVPSVRVQTLERLGEVLECGIREHFSFSGLEWEIAITKPRFGWTYVHSWSC